ncbi:MAG: bifunctional riboflavin kinase/FAD synthetase [Cyclobacteriaceae bacterium]|jgi:riboflavin kinase/FMN adenylyltransferase|nr:bifunctional riboflavin kinase/FAD synthetase [Cyclobacteriaceae bacterium]
MKIYHSLDDFVKLTYAVVTSGTFDGVHIGHQKILSRLKEIAERNGGETVVITFWPHPRLVLYPEDTSLRLLNTFEEKAELLKEQGISHLIRIPFTKEFSNLTSHEFISRILVSTIGTKKLVIGYDHRFGHNRDGSFEELKANSHLYGFEVEEIPKQEIDQVAVSSTKIRKALESGDIHTANQLLGRPYSISGRVVKGDKLGRIIGFPTANIEVDSNHKLIPADGIYAATITYEHELYRGMLYIGNRPTVGGGRHSIEINIFNFEKEIYGDSLTIHIYQLIRHDSRFTDLESLKSALYRDKIKSEEILNAILPNN